MQPQKVKKIPQRQCLGCNEHFPKKDLIRVVKRPDGSVELDLVGKVSGRGAYICKSVKCLRRAAKAKRIDKSLECSVPEDVYERMEKELSENE